MSDAAQTILVLKGRRELLAEQRKRDIAALREHLANDPKVRASLLKMFNTALHSRCIVVVRQRADRNFSFRVERLPPGNAKYCAVIGWCDHRGKQTAWSFFNSRWSAEKWIFINRAAAFWLWLRYGFKYE